MEKGKVKQIYYILLGLLVLISVLLVGILVVRANQTDKYFEFKRSEQESTQKSTYE